MKKKEFVTQDLLSKIYQNNDAGPRKLPPERPSRRVWRLPFYHPPGGRKAGKYWRRADRTRFRDLD